MLWKKPIVSYTHQTLGVRVAEKLLGNKTHDLEKEVFLLQLQCSQNLIAPPRQLITQEELVLLLDLHTTSAVKDAEHCLCFGTSLTTAKQDRIVWLMEHKRLRSWLSSQYSDVILVHGNDESERVSPISYFCSSLIDILGDQTRAKVFYFFCGRHTQLDDHDSGGLGIVRTLLSQLLVDTPQDFDLSFLREQHVDEIRRCNLFILLSLFKTLLKQLQGVNAIFCIIDGISFYESDERLAEMSLVVDKLLRISRMEEQFPIFKLLLACPTSTRYVRKSQFLRPTNIIKVPSDAPRSGQGLSKNKKNRMRAESSHYVEWVGAGNDV